MNFLGVIPARGGSKAIPRKNLAPLLDRPLLAYACQAALGSRQLTRVVLSTDDAEIAEVGRRFGVDVPFLRPATLAEDDTPMLGVLQHVLRTLEEADGYVPDAVVLLQPTSPLRRACHVDAAAEILEATGADSVVSVVEVPHQFNPVSLMRLDAGKLVPFAEGPLILRRQDKPRLYARNGPAVLASRRTVLLGGSLYGRDCRPLVMPPETSLDVDTALDLAYAEFLMQRSGVNR